MTVIQETGAALERRINNGPADLITANPEPMDDLVKKGKVVAGTVTPFVLAGLGVSVRAGAPKPDISTVEAYKAALLAAKSIGYSFGCSGTHIAEGIEKLGLTEQLKAKTVRTSGGPVTALSWRKATSRSAFSRPTSWWVCRGPTMSGRCPASSTSRARRASR